MVPASHDTTGALLDIGSYFGLGILSVFRCGKDRGHKLPQQRSGSFEFFMRERSVEKAVEKLDRKFCSPFLRAYLVANPQAKPERLFPFAEISAGQALPAAGVVADGADPEEDRFLGMPRRSSRVRPPVCTRSRFGIR
jgi:hypothetical protein